MANKARRKHVTDVNVYDAAIERIHYLYKRFDNVVVSFSGGKDSTAVLNLTIEVARELGKLPVKAIFVDEEAIHPTTVEYVERVRNHPDIDLDWYCLPVKHRNACSNEQPFWYCWNPDERGLWVYAECWPELWHKMLHRVKGVATAWRYANTELYSNWKKPENLTWKQYAEMVIESYAEPEYRDLIRQNINSMAKLHYSKTDDEIHDSVAHPISGASWKFFAKIAIKGDFKGRQSGAMTQEANAVLVKLGITLEEAKEKYGKKKRYVYGKSAGRERGLGGSESTQTE